MIERFETVKASRAREWKIDFVIIQQMKDNDVVPTLPQQSQAAERIPRVSQ
jgi:hypothetical protein